MTPGHLQIALCLALAALCVRPLGGFMARVYQAEPTPLDRLLAPVEHAIYRTSGVQPAREMPWQAYAGNVLAFNAVGFAAVYLVQRIQPWLPLNPAGLGPVRPDLAFNTAVSFASNTNWQAYLGEATLSHLTQMLALTVQNFVSAATGMAVMAALCRGLARESASTLGNFWVDLTRGTLYILVPLSLVLALALVSQGVVQSFDAAPTATLVDPTTDVDGAPVVRQVLPLAPAASQVAVKQLGTNGGGVFGANSAHPFENPTPLSSFLELLAILLIPAAQCYTFGRMVGDPRQGWAILVVMTLIFVPLLALAVAAESADNPRLAPPAIAAVAPRGGNMEGKEVRFGVAASALWATATTAASNGSVNAMHDALMPLGGLAALFLMQLGEVVFGGVGSGLYGMLVFAIVAVFVAGLMVGRTPEYLGKKVEAREMKLASLVVLIPPILVLGATALAVALPEGRASITQPGPHGLSQVLYAFTSMGNNNGSAFGGLNVDTPFYNTLGGVAMAVGRYWPIVLTLALAGALGAKKRVPSGPGTLPTHTPLFVMLLVAIVVVVGVLTFVPALALGPIVEHLNL